MIPLNEHQERVIEEITDDLKREVMRRMMEKANAIIAKRFDQSSAK